MTRPADEPQTTRLNFRTYLAMVNNAPGSRMFRQFYLRGADGTEFDAIGNGENACAFFVSSVLVIFQQIKRVHGLVTSTVKDLEDSGWRKVDSPQRGDVLVWATAQQSDGRHAHIGFYVGNGRAVSTSSSRGEVAEHDLHFGAEHRPLTSIYRQSHWD